MTQDFKQSLNHKRKPYTVGSQLRGASVHIDPSFFESPFCTIQPGSSELLAKSEASKFCPGMKQTVGFETNV